MTEHPELLFSAYLDDALTQGEHDLVSEHLDGCARCRGRVAELRAISRLIGGLPQLAPRRSLAPRLDRAPVWLRPLRLLGAMGSGLFVFLFLASAVINTGSSLGGGTTTAERLAEKGQFGPAVSALASDAAAKSIATAAPAAAPAAGTAAQSPLVDAASGRDANAAAPTPVARVDTQGATGAPSTAASGPSFGPPPLVFLGVALLCAVAALVAHRRLRRS